jgi:type IV pilus assembly protein PilY1
MRKLSSSHLALLLVCATLPFVSDAGQANCCNMAASITSDLFPGGSGDEDFFTVPGGPPSVMILLDNSGSMMDFPQALPFPALANGEGKCDVAAFADASAARLTGGQQTFERPFAFTNGNSSAPSWVTRESGADCKTNPNACLFKPTAYYRYVPDADSPNIKPALHDWDNNSGVEKTAEQACEGLSTSGTAGSTARDRCTTCLANSGYYLYRADVGVGTQPVGTLRAAFAGSFLNVYPPKFIIARKVLKEMLAIDPASPSAGDNVRVGLTTFTSPGPLKPILPNCTDAITPPNNDPTALANFVTARAGLLTALDSVTFDTTTPLADTLFKVGQYFSDGDTSDGTGSQWKTWFGDSAWSSAWWNGVGSTRSICWSCQQSSVLVITDGAPKDDNHLPANASADRDTLFTREASCAIDTSLGCRNGDFGHWKGGTVGSARIPIDCPEADCGKDLGRDQRNLLHLVAAHLRWADLRAPKPAGDTSTTHMSGRQSVTTYTVGLNLPAGSTAVKLLQKTADLGGGFFVNADSPDALGDAIFNVVTDVVTKTTSFSVSNTNTLQAATAAQLFTARFRPLDRLSYEGHVYRFTLFNELALGCDPGKPQAQQPRITCGTATNVNANLDGKLAGTNADCSGFYIVDKDCDPVVEDPATGAFKKGTFDASGNLTATLTDAAPFWDAGKVLSDPAQPGYRSASSTADNRRKIYTVVDNNGGTADGKFTAADTKIEFTAGNVDDLRPYLGLDGAWCGRLFDRLGFVKPGTGWGTEELRKCAKQVIWFIRGYDVLDEDDDGCAGPGGLTADERQHPKACASDADCSPSTAGSCNAGRCTCAAGDRGEERDLTAGHWKLGDIFHSSPQVVDPPYNEFLCGLQRGQTQCVPTIYSPAALTKETQTAIDVTAGKDAYEQYRTNGGSPLKDRRRIVLAGGNDGMLHAFDAGEPDTAAAADVFGSRPYTQGTGGELWAFIPPDLLPKLKDALDGHQYYVDGNVMVRDVWEDANGDRIKQSGEFHTLAVMSERAGGTQFVALDVTNPEDPVFRWTFPQLCSVEASLVGQSWSDFSPRPPPIGPVKLRLPGGATDGKGRNFEERWIAMLNGGYDAGAARGRGVWMVDAWTGDILWRFTDQEFQQQYTDAGSSTLATMFPVAASVGLEDIGNADQAVIDSDGYFDTATWGDLGGQLWVARFKEPGTLVSGRVTNWKAARAMEELRRPDNKQTFSETQADNVTKQFRSEFYRMTANMWDPESAVLRTFLGSGNRERLLTVAPSCGPGNVIGCAQSECNVIRLDSTVTMGACTVNSVFQDNSDHMQHNEVTQSAGCTGAIDCSAGVSARVLLHLQGCNSTNPPDLQARIACDGNGSCSERIKVGKTKNLNTKNWPALTSHNRFYGVWSYSSGRSFDNATTAVTFDRNRFTDVPIAGVTCAGPTGNACTLVNTTTATVAASGAVTCGTGVTKCSATASDPGWFYEYGRKDPVTGGAASWTDEKTGSGATVLNSCVDWNTIRPMGAAVTSTPCEAGAGFPRNYTYLADGITGVPSGKFCGFQANATADVQRASSRESIAPPLDPTMVVTVTESGGVKPTALQIEPGVMTSKDMAETSEVSHPMYWLEVPRDLHACRHVDATLCNAQ